MANTTELLSEIWSNSTTSPLMNFDNSTTEVSTATLRLVKQKSRGSLFQLVVQTYMTPSLACVGIVLNCLVLLLMRRPRISSSLISVYLFTLAISDLGLLLTLLIRQIHHYFPVPRVSVSHKAACAILSFTGDYFLAYSSWIITTIGIERAFAIKFPLKSVKISNQFKAKLTLCILAFILGAILCHIFFMADILVFNGYKRCSVKPAFRYFDTQVRFHLMGTLNSYIPFALLVACNIILVKALAVANARRKSMSTNSQQLNLEKFTITAVILCVSFWLVTTTCSILLIIIRLPQFYTDYSARINDIRAAVSFILAARASLNFFLYIITSRDLRKEIASILKCSKPPGRYLERGTNEGTRKPQATVNTNVTSQSANSAEIIN